MTETIIKSGSKIKKIFIDRIFMSLIKLLLTISIIDFDDIEKEIIINSINPIFNIV